MPRAGHYEEIYVITIHVSFIFIPRVSRNSRICLNVKFDCLVSRERLRSLRRPYEKFKAETDHLCIVLQVIQSVQ